MKCDCCNSPLMAITHDYIWFECGWVMPRHLPDDNCYSGFVFPCERQNMKVHRCSADNGAMMSFTQWLTKLNAGQTTTNSGYELCRKSDK